MNFATHLALLPILSRLYPYFYPLFNMQISLFLIKITLHCFWGFLCVIFTFPFIFWLFFENTFWACHRGGVGISRAWSIIVCIAAAENENQNSIPKRGRGSATTEGERLLAWEILSRLVF